jgi:hypothetical protein
MISGYGSSVHPIERLRFVARAGDGDGAFLAAEAAEALAGLACEPRALVTACRRLLDAHPTRGPLWWVAARVLAGPDPVAAALEARALIGDDDTVEELAGCLPAGAVVVAEPSPVALGALARRRDLSARFVASSPGRRRAALQATRGALEVTAWDCTEAEAALDGATLVLAEPLAAGPSGVLLSKEAGHLVALARGAGTAVWAGVPVGCLLPQELFAACCERSAETERPEAADARRTVVVACAELDVVVRATGPAQPTAALATSDCPAPAELLHRSG